ncbi:MAG TPA: NAD(P)(+) transhydrogenase (Re/Si-specific) subunit beta [Thermoleophilaceae bacterium]|nr:NAD(P)(+) transhydrogenase (Re/Si-specific) subunit beta [Thermoleophilaceae bacterium]
METLTTLVYLVAAGLFIAGIRMLRQPETARAGNVVAALGMLLAVGITFVEAEILGFLGVAAGMAVGTVIGLVSARRVPMTSMPQFVAAFNGVGGGAVALIAFAEFHRLEQQGGGEGFVVLLTIFLGILIGSVSFAGSGVAFGKLEDRFLTGSITFPGQAAANLAVLAVAVALAVNAMADGFAPVVSAALVLVLALVLGVLLVMPIGGADMPIVISLLNAFTGVAAATSGFVLTNVVLIIGGALVGASGSILTYMMSNALGRPLGKIVFGAIGGAPTGPEGGDEAEERPVTSVGAGDVATALEYEADSVVFVPGYGLAVAQAQSAMAELAAALERKGKEVKFAIHPVAGRMPGHMNVLLAEAEVDHEKLFDLEDINEEFPETDAVVIVGANDVVNPAARDGGDSPIAGMPILDVDRARRVVFVKRSLSPGFAGVDNPLFYDQERTMMMFSDAKEGLEDVVAAVKSR